MQYLLLVSAKLIKYFSPCFDIGVNGPHRPDDIWDVRSAIWGVAKWDARFFLAGLQLLHVKCEGFFSVQVAGQGEVLAWPLAVEFEGLSARVPNVSSRKCLFSWRFSFVGAGQVWFCCEGSEVLLMSLQVWR